MRSWFSLVALICFALGTVLLDLTWHVRGALPMRVVFYGLFPLAFAAAIASLLRRERWRIGSLSVLGLTLVYWLLLATIMHKAEEIRALLAGR